MGVLYVTGTGVKKDVPFAESLFEKAFRKGNGTAAAYLGDIYYFGSLGTVDLVAAEKWFEAGVHLHDPIATYNLGSLYSVDKRHDHDFHKATLLMRRAAGQGYVPALHSLALLLINHPQEEQTNGEVRSLLETAAAAGEQPSTSVPPTTTSMSLSFREASRQRICSCTISPNLIRHSTPHSERPFWRRLGSGIASTSRKRASSLEIREKLNSFPCRTTWNPFEMFLLRH
jgi:TPR repeat protein